jgi:hypothetical protein
MKTQIVLPDAVAETLKVVVPPRKRSQFIAEAVEARLRALKFQRVLKTTAGSWTDKNHPDLNTQTDVNRYLARFRERFS